jgi:hypothetical protein
VYVNVVSIIVFFSINFSFLVMFLFKKNYGIKFMYNLFISFLVQSFVLFIIYPFKHIIDVLA